MATSEETKRHLIWVTGVLVFLGMIFFMARQEEQNRSDRFKACVAAGNNASECAAASRK